MPSLLVLCTRSDPARSTKCNFDLRTLSEPPAPLHSRKTVNKQWEREDAWFIAVSLMARFVSPRNSKLRASSSEVARCMDRFLK